MTETQGARTSQRLDRLGTQVAVVVVLVVLVRTAAAVAFRHSFFTSGEQIFDSLARSVVDGRGLSFNGHPYVENPPGYTLFVASAYEIGGRGWWSVALLQTMVDCGTAVLLLLLGRRLLGATTAFAAAVGFALYPYLASQSVQVIDTSLFCFFLVAFVYFLVRAAARPRVVTAIALGLSIGLGFLVRAPIAVLALASPAFLALLGARRGSIAKVSAVAGITALCCVTPWIVRNEVRFHEFIPASAKAGANFWKGNNPHTASYVASGRSVDLLTQLPDAPRPPAGLGPSAEDSWWLHRGLDWATRHPGAWAKTTLVKLWAFWSPILNPRTGGNTHLKAAAYTVTYGILIALAAVGVALLARGGQRRGLVLLLLLLALWTAVNVPFVGYTRIRTPVDPLLMLLAGSTVGAYVGRMRGRG